MEIKKTISTVMSMAMMLSSAAYVPINYVYAVDGTENVQEINEPETREYKIARGQLNVSAPDKVYYKIGEELDLTGGRISGSGGIVLITNGGGNTVMNWDNFGRDLTVDDLDISEFDNTKPGIYKITAKSMGFSVDSDETYYGSFYVMVIKGDEVTEEDKLEFEDVTESYYYTNGTVYLTPPDKTVYKEGEQLDLTGCTISGSGCIFKGNPKYDSPKYMDTWIIDERQATEADLWLKDIDMNAPGDYYISAYITSINGYLLNGWNTDCKGFYITVKEDDHKTADETESLPVTTAPYITSYCAAETTITTGTHNDHEIIRDNAVVIDVQDNTIIIDDGTKLTYNNNMSSEIGKVKKGDIIEVKGYYHYLADTQEYTACSGTFGIIKSADDAPAVTTAVNPKNTGTKKTVIYTGAKEFEAISIDTYPTQTVFIEGEELNTAGLDIKAQRYIPYESLGLDKDEYEPEPVSSLSNINIEPYSMTVIDENGKKYNGSRMCQLPAGKYKVVCDSKEAEVIGYIDYILDADISYDIEIKKSDRKLDYEQTEYSDDKKICCDYRYDFRLMGVASYPEKTVYSKGDELDITGLIIKAKKEYRFDASEYAEEPVFLKTILPSDDIITITDSNGKEYTKSEFASLPEGKYTVSFVSDEGLWDNYIHRIKNLDISYEIEIKQPDAKSDSKGSDKKGDANTDGALDLADAVLIMQTLANPDKYEMSEQGRKNADIYGENDGITNMDALQIQKILLKLI